MYGSYGSYSSMSAITAPMDITSNNLRTHDAACAFPSWPRGVSFSDYDSEPRATSYLSDDDLFPSDPLDDDVRSVSSSSTASSPSAINSPQQMISEAELFEMERERAALQREYVRQVMYEKEKRRQSMKKRRSNSGSSSSSKKSPKSKLSSMTPINECD